MQYLKENIEAENWKVGEKIPSENQLTSTLGVSRSSVRNALRYMIGIGVLESIHGKGTYLNLRESTLWWLKWKQTSQDFMRCIWGTILMYNYVIH